MGKGVGYVTTDGNWSFGGEHAVVYAEAEI